MMPAAVTLYEGPVAGHGGLLREPAVARGSYSEPDGFRRDGHLDRHGLLPIPVGVSSQVKLGRLRPPPLFPHEFQNRCAFPGAAAGERERSCRPMCSARLQFHHRARALLPLGAWPGRRPVLPLRAGVQFRFRASGMASTALSRCAESHVAERRTIRAEVPVHVGRGMVRGHGPCKDRRLKADAANSPSRSSARPRQFIHDAIDDASDRFETDITTHRHMHSHHRADAGNMMELAPITSATSEFRVEPARAAKHVRLDSRKQTAAPVSVAKQCDRGRVEACARIHGEWSKAG